MVEEEGAEGVGPGEGQLRLRVVGGEEMSCPRDGSLLNPYLIVIAAEYKENFSKVTLFSVAIYMKQTRILCGQLNCSVNLADVSTRCSSHPQAQQLSCPQRIFAV